ncbi:DUF1292 domain-containing protein [Metabacillus niabensis]|uniref:DUF1292 domain-containing protein n=1 Tax=Metabacillus niabensis TaxID=324854 RepID=UPI0011A01ED3
MNLEAGDKLSVPISEGEEVIYSVLFIFEDETTGFQYVALVDESKVEDNADINVEAMRFEMDEHDEITFYQLETDEEWEMFEEVFNKYVEEQDEE